MMSLAVSPVLAVVSILHALAAVIWVGGMFFAWAMLRPAAAGLDPVTRCGLWVAVLHRFFRWIWAVVAVLFVTGNLRVIAVFASFRFAPTHVHLMQGLAVLMTLVFLYVHFGPWRRLRRAVGEQRWDDGTAQLGRIRKLVLVNLLLGLATVAVGAGGRYI